MNPTARYAACIKAFLAGIIKKYGSYLYHSFRTDVVPVVGLEPTRGISPTDFESVTSTIPSHRRSSVTIIQNAGKFKSNFDRCQKPGYPGFNISGKKSLPFALLSWYSKMLKWEKRDLLHETLQKALPTLTAEYVS